ncbi:30S ribosomal protein S18 [bacterium]|nr:30S ribosomal protein S18 [bacterium]
MYKEGNRGASNSNYKRAPRRKVCPFCANKVEDIDYIALAKDIEKNSEKSYDRSGERRPRYVAENGKIIPRRTSGVCVKHQRLLAQAIKRARIMALLPFKGE